MERQPLEPLKSSENKPKKFKKGERPGPKCSKEKKPEEKTTDSDQENHNYEDTENRNQENTELTAEEMRQRLQEIGAVDLIGKKFLDFAKVRQIWPESILCHEICIL